MATLFEMADKVKPKTKLTVIGVILFSLFCVLLPDNKPVSHPYTSPVTTPIVKTTPTPSTPSIENSPAFTSATANPINPGLFNSDLNTHVDVPAPTPTPSAVSTPIAAATQKIEPSFDCAKAQGGIEKLICADGDLAALDKKVADKYFDKLLKAPKESAEDIKQDQRDFLKFRITACQVPTDLTAGTPVGKYIPCLENIYGQRLTSFDQGAPEVSQEQLENELPWLKEKRLNGEVVHNDDQPTAEPEKPAPPLFNQLDFNACMDGDSSRCHFETMNPQQQAVINQSFSRNYSFCLNGLTYACKRSMLTPDQLEKVQQSDLQRNYISCMNGLSYACNKSLLTMDQQITVNHSDMQRNLNSCLNGLTYACNKNWLSPEQREQVSRSDLQRNYYSCLNGLTYACNRQLLTAEQLSKMNK